jgi:hypothetical protein
MGISTSRWDNEGKYYTSHTLQSIFYLYFNLYIWEDKMSKKLLREIWEETPIRFGKYKHKTNGNVAFASRSHVKGREWEIDKGKVQNHPIFRIKVKVVEEGTGNYFFWRSLKNYEFVSELEWEKANEK